MSWPAADNVVVLTVSMVIGRMVANDRAKRRRGGRSLRDYQIEMSIATFNGVPLFSQCSRAVSLSLTLLSTMRENLSSLAQSLGIHHLSSNPFSSSSRGSILPPFGHISFQRYPQNPHILYVIGRSFQFSFLLPVEVADDVGRRWAGDGEWIWERKKEIPGSGVWSVSRLSTAGIVPCEISNSVDNIEFFDDDVDDLRYIFIVMVSFDLSNCD